MQKIPKISKEILDLLREIFPNVCPDEKSTEKEVWLKMGEQRVIRAIQGFYDKTSGNGSDSQDY